MTEKNTILIVDDYEFNRQLLSELFPDREIIEAANGSVAIEEYEKHKDEICAVLTDIMMPVTDGFGLLEYFHKNKHSEDTPIFVISADSSGKLIAKAFQFGAEAVITKPFNSNFVKKHIDHIIELFRLREIAGNCSTQTVDDDFM